MQKRKWIALVILIFVLVATGGVGMFLILDKQEIAPTGNKANIEWYTEDGEEFVITTVDELYGLVKLSDYYNFSGQTIKLGADIVVNDGNAEDWAEHTPTKRWYPIDGFAGVFDGQGHSISGIYGYGIDTEMGLFANTTMSSVIKDVKLLNSYFEADGMKPVGSIASNGCGTFEKLYSDAIIRSNGQKCGGIVGNINDDGTVSTTAKTSKMYNCWFDGNIELTTRTGIYGGGLIGYINGGSLTIAHCLNSGSLSAECTDSAGIHLGGIFGALTYTYSGSVIVEDTLNVGKIHSKTTAAIGSLAGSARSSKLTMDIKDTYVTDDSCESFCTSDASTRTTSPVSINTEFIQGEEWYSYSTLDYEQYWTVTKDSTPILRYFADEVIDTSALQKAYSIDWYNQYSQEFILDSVEDLYGLAILSSRETFANKVVKLGADIKVNEGKATKWASGKAVPEKQWIPIGRENAFQGVFDGDGHTISGLYGKTNARYMGLFGWCGKYSEVKNLRITNSCFISTKTGNSGLGSVAGRIYGGKFDTIYSDAIIMTTGEMNGGIIGYKTGDSQSEINNCWYEGTISLLGDKSKYGAGIISRLNEGELIMSNCLFSGKISAFGEKRSACAGGLIGMSAYNLTIKDCLNTGEMEIAEAEGMNSLWCLIGYVSNTETTTVTLENVYYTGLGDNTKYYLYAGGDKPTIKGHAEYKEESEIAGYSGFQTTGLDFNKYWAVVLNEDDTPILKSFAKTKPSVAGLDRTFDKSWYDPEKSTYILKDSKDLYGLMYLSNSKIDFKDKTIILANDIKVNEGLAVDWLNGINIPSAAYNWRGIGRYTTFKGIFDGQGHTISGIYGVADTTKHGLISSLGADGVVKNVRLTNSYLESTATGNTAIGSFVGYLEGNIDTVYSDAIISSKGFLNGGIAGYKNSNNKSSIVNSWYAGTIYMNGDASKHNGGIIGRLFKGELEISNCLFTGKIYIGGELRSANTGGFIGSVEKGTLTLTGCLNDGEFEITEAKNMNSTSRDIGQVYNDKDVKVIINDTYFTKKGDRSTNFYYCAGDKPTRIGGSEMKMIDDIKGYDGYRTTSLDFDNYWAVVIDEDSSPILKAFASEVPSVEGLERIFDKSWYDETKTTYVLKDRKDLYGMAYLLNSKINFKGKKVTLGNDITVNEVGNADEWLKGSIPTYEWVPMGRNLTFEGTFDGKGYTISGLYGVTDSAYMGLFAYAGASSKIQNLKITNSYFESIMTGYAAIGSVAGRTEGDICNVYSDAIVKSAGLLNGGIVGYRDSKNQTTFSNCWYAGDIHMVGDASSRTGGIIGHLMNGQLELDNCLFSGKIYVGGKTRATNTGGFAGYVSTELTLKDSLNSGEFIVTDANSQNALGRIIGQIKADKSTIVTLEDVYFTNKGARGTYTWYRLEKETGGNYLSTVDGIVTQVSEEEIMGEYGYYSMQLDFNKYWTTVLDNEATTDKDETGTPVLQSFATIINPIPTAPTYADISWYDDKDETYTLENKEELLGLSYLSKMGITFEGKTIEIADTVEEINFNEASATQKYEWDPIGWRVPFKGTFDGKGVTISGLEVTDASTSTVGLFGKTNGATIKNLKLKDSNFNGTSTIGSIVGEGNGSFENIYSDVQLNGTKHVGGIVGKVNGNSNFTKCWYEGNISTSEKSGGIIGEISSGTVTMTNCLYTGNLASTATTSTPYVSGFVGYVGDSSTLIINTSLATGTIALPDTATHAWKGWAVSYTQQGGGDVTITDSYAYKNGLTRAVGTGSSLYLNTGLDAATIKGDALVNATIGLDWEKTYATKYNGKAALRGLIANDKLATVDTTWYDDATTNEAGDQPGTKNNPYKLSKVAELYGLAKFVNGGNDFDGKYLELADDIDVNQLTIDPTSENWATLSAELRAWNPIGTTTETAFKGIFDGKGHTISGLYTVGATDEAIGLFGHVKGATIQNLRLTNSYFKGVNQVASIVGKGHGNFENIYSDVRIDAEIQTGGIVGFANGNSSLTKCWYDGTLATRYHSGGIIGAIGSSSAVAQVTMTNCLNTGIISSTASENDSTTYSDVTASHINYKYPYVSGFAGYVHDSSQLTINTSLSVGTITLPSVATHNWKGWAVSYTQSGGGDVTITDSYAYKNGLSRAIGTGSSLYLNTGLDTSQITGDALKNATSQLNWNNIFVLQSNGKPGIKGLFQTNQ